MSFLQSCCFCSSVPVEDNLEGNDGVDDTAADIGEDHNVVSSLLDTGEDSGNGTETEKEASDGGELTSVAVAKVGHNLDQFT